MKPLGYALTTGAIVSATFARGLVCPFRTKALGQLGGTLFVVQGRCARLIGWG